MGGWGMGGWGTPRIGGMGEDGPRLGSWARSGDLVGLVAAVDADEVAVFDPAERQVVRVPRGELLPVPAGAVTITVAVDLPLAHGLGEDAVRRWTASLVDGVLRERATAALSAAGLDPGAALPEARVEVSASMTDGAVCLAGHRSPAPDGAAVACATCGRDAVARPVAGR